MPIFFLVKKSYLSEKIEIPECAQYCPISDAVVPVLPISDSLALVGQVVEPPAGTGGGFSSTAVGKSWAIASHYTVSAGTHL